LPLRQRADHRSLNLREFFHSSFPQWNSRPLRDSAWVERRMSVAGRFCCKSRYALLIKNFPGCRRGFRVNMWGTSSHGDELTGNFANEFDAISIDDRGLFRLLAGKLSDGNLGLLQQNRP